MKKINQNNIILLSNLLDLYFAHIDNNFLFQYGANMGVMDNEEMRPIDHFIRDRKVDVTSNQFNEVYCWGTNANYNLGTGSLQTRETPELLDSLKRVSIKQVSWRSIKKRLLIE